MATATMQPIVGSAGVIEGVRIIGTVSKNGRDYPPEVLRAAVPLYEGAKVNLDHPERLNAPRSVNDRIGVLRKVRFENNGIHADLHYNPNHSFANRLEWFAKHQPEAIGFSPNHIIRQRRGVVEAIDAVNSVDLVADPATTNGVFESVSGHITPQAWRSRVLGRNSRGGGIVTEGVANQWLKRIRSKQ